VPPKCKKAYSRGDTYFLNIDLKTPPAQSAQNTAQKIAISNTSVLIVI